MEKYLKTWEHISHHDVPRIKSLWYRNSPREWSSGDRQVSKAVFFQAAQNNLFMCVRLNKIRTINFNVLNQLFCEPTHTKEITILLHALQGKTISGVFESIRFGFCIGDENFFSFIIPTLIGREINIATIGATAPKILCCQCMTSIRSSDKIRVAHQKSSLKRLKAIYVLITVGQRGNPRSFSWVGNFLSMLIGSGDKICVAT